MIQNKYYNFKKLVCSLKNLRLNVPFKILTAHGTVSFFMAYIGQKNKQRMKIKKLILIFFYYYKWVSKKYEKNLKLKKISLVKKFNFNMLYILNLESEKFNFKCFRLKN